MTRLLNAIPDLSNRSVAVFGDIENELLEFLKIQTRSIKVFNKNENINEQYEVVLCLWRFGASSNEEVFTDLAQFLSNMPLGGSLVMVEKCYPGTRNPGNFTDLVESVTSEIKSGAARFEVQHINPVQEAGHGKVEDFVWTAHVKPSKSSGSDFATIQQFLNASQYNRNGILRYEKIFGRHFISTGGKYTTQMFVDKLGLREGMRVLDVGAGIGGSAFLMAEQFKVEVLGIDLSSNMISIAWESNNELNHPDVRFEVCDATKQKYKPGSFDLIYSRDTLLHIPNKAHLFKLFYSWLKPGGQLFISDYCAKEGEWNKDFIEYVKQRNYQLIDVKKYGKQIEDAGFSNVKAENVSELFVQVLEKELKHLYSIKDEFLKEHSEEDFDAINVGWNNKLQRVAKGDQRWGTFHAHKRQ